MQEWEWNFQMGKLVICALRLLIMCECVNWRYVTLVDFAERREQRVSLISGVFFKKENVFRASVNTESEAKILQSIKQSWSLTDLCADYKLSPALIQQNLVQRFAANPDPVRPFLPLQPTLPPVTQDHMGCELIRFNSFNVKMLSCLSCTTTTCFSATPDTATLGTLWSRATKKLGAASNEPLNNVQRTKTSSADFFGTPRLMLAYRNFSP